MTVSFLNCDCDERLLAEKAKRGDRSALDELARRTMPAVLAFVRETLAPHDADEVVQETFLRAVKRIQTLPDPDKFHHWVFALAAQEVRRFTLRRAVWRSRLADQDLPIILDPDEPEALIMTKIAVSERALQMERASRWLDSEDRRLLEFLYQEREALPDCKRVAAELGISQAYAKIRLHRLRTRFVTSVGVHHAVSAAMEGSGCVQLHVMLRTWDGEPSPLWRKRVNRHIRECRAAANRQSSC